MDAWNIDPDRLHPANEYPRFVSPPSAPNTRHVDLADYVVKIGDNSSNGMSRVQLWMRPNEYTTAKAEKLVLLTNTPGVLDEQGKLLTGITPKEVDAMVASGVLSGGMLPKIASALDAARNGVKSVHIIDGRVEHALLLEILTDEGVGTLIKSQ